MEVLVCQICRREQEINAHGHLAERPDGTEIIHPNREEWPVPTEQQFIARPETKGETQGEVDEAALVQEADEDMSDREYTQADDEAIGEEHSEMLKRIGLTQDEWEDGIR